MLEKIILGDHEDSKNSLKIKSLNALFAAQRRGGREPEQYAPYATRGCMENASLIQVLTAKGMYALFYLMRYSSGP
jgi:hypothetical protein